MFPRCVRKTTSSFSPPYIRDKSTFSPSLSLSLAVYKQQLVTTYILSTSPTIPSNALPIYRHFSRRPDESSTFDHRIDSLSLRYVDHVDIVWFSRFDHPHKYSAKYFKHSGCKTLAGTSFRISDIIRIIGIVFFSLSLSLSPFFLKVLLDVGR